MRRDVVRWVVLFSIAAAALTGQSELATLTGTVTDPSGAVINNVAVTITQEATNLATAVSTNESGRYLASNLKPGVYTVTASLAGFKKFVNSGVTLQVSSATRLDITLAVGETTEQVTVTADAPLLDAESSNRGAVIDERKIVELPLNGRDYNQLATLSPGVLLSTPRLQSIGFKGVFNVNGNRAFQNAFLLDGVDNTSYSNSFRGNNMQVVQPSIDALQEFKIQTNAYSAEYGRSSGALVNAVIKSGTNAFHGSAYEFHRNKVLDANSFFSNKTSAAKPFRLRNQFGATGGGPIVRDKTFYFGDYEGLRDRVGRVWLSSVPQTIWKSGLFTIPILNPFNPADTTGADFRIPATANCNNGSGSCWQIPANMIDGVGKRIIDVAPAPNTGAPGAIDNNFVHVPITTNRTDQFDVRVDHHASSKAILFGRYSFVDTTLFTPAPRPGLAEGSRNDTFGAALWRSQGIAAGWTQVFTPAAVSDFRFGFSRGNFFQTPPNFGSGCPEALIGLRGAPTDESICGGLPVINLTGSIERRLGRTTSVPQFQTPRSVDIRDSLSWTRGNHALKLGGEILHLQTGIRDVSALLGAFTFSGRFTGNNNVFQGAAADLLLGLPTRYQQDSNTVFNQWQKVFFLYAQDDWRVNRKLTLNYGLRYEFGTPPRERDNQWSNYDFGTSQFVNAKDGDLYSKALIRPDKNNLAPRFGFAWTPLGKTVLRGAYGMFYNHSNRMGREGLLGFNPPFIIQRDDNIGGAQNLKVADARLRLSTGVPAGFIDINRVDLRTVSRKAQDSGQRTTYVQQWNFGIQQELARDLVVDVAYVGNKGTKLAALRNLNQAAVVFNAQGAPSAGARPLAPNFTADTIQILENLAVSNYHSFQTRLEKRFSGGLSLLSSYTWGKALTNSVDHLSTSGAGNGIDVGASREPQNGLDRTSEYGLAEFDVKHRWVTSAVWQIPYGRGQKHGSSIHRAVDVLVGGWEFSPIVSAQTGLGLTVTQPQILNLGGERKTRPNRIGHGSLPENERTVDRYLNRDAFSILQVNPALAGFVANQAFGNSGVGILRGPGLVNLDFNLAKTFKFTETQALQFRAEFFNTFNHPNFGVPGVDLQASFGQITALSTEPRIIQFALKYRF